jgi:hypothetical protein
MTRFRYSFVVVILLSWITSILLQYVPRFQEWSLLIGLGCILIVIVFALSALITRSWNALATFSLLLVVLMGSWIAEFTYRLNNICGPGYHIIQTEADAIEVANLGIGKRTTAATAYPDTSMRSLAPWTLVKLIIVARLPEAEPPSALSCGRSV